MIEIKIQHILTLSYLLSKGAKYNYVPITTTSLGKHIKKSQQAASLHLVELDDGGYIKRIINGRKTSVKITLKGYSEVTRLAATLRSSLESSISCIKLCGSLVSGMGEGAYYMSLKGYTRQFKEKIDYIPFPGTLNVKLDNKDNIATISQLDIIDGVIINGFSDQKRTYGWVKCFAAKINDSIDCHIIRLERTHHDTSVIEIISEIDIRGTTKLVDGSKITIKIPMLE